MQLPVPSGEPFLTDYHRPSLGYHILEPVEQFYITCNNWEDSISIIINWDVDFWDGNYINILTAKKTTTSTAK